MTSEPTIASGRSRFGFLASSLPVRDRVEADVGEEDDRRRGDHSRAPCGANGVKLPVLNAVNATTMKKISTASLTTTMTRLTAALSRVPRTSSRVIASTMKTAGRLKTPPSSGDVEIASGSWKPNAVSRKTLRLPPQPTATAATETPYSRIRSQPMIKATSSPRVAYA